MASSSRYLLQGNPSQLNPARFASRACVPSQRNGASARAAWSPASELNHEANARKVGRSSSSQMAASRILAAAVAVSVGSCSSPGLHNAIRQPRVPSRDQQKGCRGDGLNRGGVLVQALQDSSHGGGSEREG